METTTRRTIRMLRASWFLFAAVPIPLVLLPFGLHLPIWSVSCWAMGFTVLGASLRYRSGPAVDAISGSDVFLVEK